MHLVLLLGLDNSLYLLNVYLLAFGVVPMLTVCLDVFLDISPFTPLTKHRLSVAWFEPTWTPIIGLLGLY